MIHEQQIEAFNRWLSDGETWIGIFECKDLGHPMLGRRIAVSFDDEFFEMATLGTTTAPDMEGFPILGFGWRWVLVHKARDAHDALMHLERRVEVPIRSWRNDHPCPDCGAVGDHRCKPGWKKHENLY